jgi:uncharacterized delta-60 repeat protein
MRPVLFAPALLALAALPATAQQSALDPTFGDGGALQTDLRFSPSELFLEGDEALVAGTLYPGTSSSGDVAVVRVLADGSLDASFGADGVAASDLGGDDAAFDAVRYADGRFLLAGRVGVAPAVARLLADGSLDASFGTGGVATIALDGGVNSATTVALLPGGAILLGGSDGSDGVFSARLLADGTLDGTYATGGIGRFDLDYDNGLPLGGYAQDDGTLILTGIDNGLNGGDAFVTRIAPDGSLDASFGTDGTVRLDAPPVSFIGRDYGIEAIPLGGGGLLVAMRAEVQASSGPYAGALNENLTWTRLLPDGSVDVSFGTDGFSAPDRTDLPFPDRTAAGLHLDDGRLLIAGETNDAEVKTGDLVVARFSADGALDAGFGAGGFAQYDGGAGERTGAMAVLDDGRILVAGQQHTFGDGGFGRLLLVRFLGDAPAPDPADQDGRLDPTFGDDGVVRMPGASYFTFEVEQRPDGRLLAAFDSTGADGRYNLAVQTLSADGDLLGAPMLTGAPAGATVIEADGSITVAGILSRDGGADGFVSRVTPDGTLDAAFNGGTVLLDGGEGFASFSAARLDSEGRVLATGLLGTERRVLRYLPDGSLDASFGADGVVTPSFAGADQFNPSGLWPLEGGAFFLGGTINGPSGGIVVARYDGSGVLDEGFGDGGRIVVSRSNATEQFVRFAERPDGGVYALGETFQAGNQQGRVVAVGPEGLDASFADGGVLAVDALVGDGVVDAVEQPDGRLVTLARSSYFGNGASFNVAVLDRYAGARLDPTFAPDGMGRIYETFGYGDVSPRSLTEQRGEGLLAAVLATDGSARYLARYDAPVRVDVQDESAGQPTASALSIWPNPAVGATSVRLDLSNVETARVTVLDVLGREVAVLHDGAVARDHTWRMPAALVPGVYTVLAEIGRERLAARFTVVR